jgi:hypothetical protein
LVTATCADWELVVDGTATVAAMQLIVGGVGDAVVEVVVVGVVVLMGSMCSFFMGTLLAKNVIDTSRA